MTVRPFLAALSFLTVFPATLSRDLTRREISDSRIYYPAVGLLIGLLLAGVERASGAVFPASLTAALLLALLIAITRGLHLDGFMDICDGLFGGYTPERRLEIMKDSHVGAFAVAGAGGLLLVKYGALLSLLTLAAPGKEWALLLFPLLSRWSMVVLLGAFPYVRREGLGSPFHQGNSGLATALAAMIAVVASALLGGVGGAALLAAATAVAWGLGWGMTRLLGGLTGDAYGAANETIEALALIAAVALLPHGLLEPLPKLLGIM